MKLFNIILKWFISFDSKRLDVHYSLQLQHGPNEDMLIWFFHVITRLWHTFLLFLCCFHVRVVFRSRCFLPFGWWAECVTDGDRAQGAKAAGLLIPFSERTPPALPPNETDIRQFSQGEQSSSPMETTNYQRILKYMITICKCQLEEKVKTFS